MSLMSHKTSLILFYSYGSYAHVVKYIFPFTIIVIKVDTMAMVEEKSNNFTQSVSLVAELWAHNNKSQKVKMFTEMQQFIPA